MNDIIQLKITLLDTKPPIWRRIQVDKNTTFFELHHIIQIVMGWDDYHLHEFVFRDHTIGVPNHESANFGFGPDKTIDSAGVTLENVHVKPKEKFKYIYDFGDGWDHQIVVEKFLPGDPSVIYPVCTDGKLNCPPEDCGGVWGYYNLIDVINDPKHPEHEEMLEWLGEAFDPEYFNINDVNEALNSLDEYLAEEEDDEE